MSQKAPEMTTAEELQALRLLVENLSAKTAMQEEQLVALSKATGGVSILAPEDTPIYEIGPAHYYSPDDIFYPEGTQIEDITGQIIPNENMIPLNEPARLRMEKYLRSLPQQGTPSFEFIIQAAMELRPREGDDPKLMANYHAKILERAMTLKAVSEGRLPTEAAQIKIPTRVIREGQSAPIMPNTKIRQGDIAKRDLVGAGSSSTSAPRSTRQRQEATPPANKTAPAMGTVQNLPLGSEPQGVKI